ncbi:MAG: TonB-dependent receptor [Candidatus Omnitrophica bacterium]|nr:TonB-dependent receptor [Candidatus Omnitrophota bacterium]
MKKGRWSIVYGLWSMVVWLGAAYADDTGMNLEKIIVTPSRYEESYKNSTVDVSVVDQGEVAKSGATEITQILETLPSINILNYGSYGSTKSVHTRGASSSQVVTLIDGRPVNTPRDGETDHNTIPLNNIERIEVSRGPAASIYGANAVGGVINIITKSGKEKMFTEVNSKAGSFFTFEGDIAHGWKPGAFDYFISLNRIESQGHRDNSDYEQSNYNVKLGYDINNDNRLTLETGYLASEAGTPGRNSDPDLDDRQEQWKDYMDLTWEGACWQDSKVLLKIYENLDRLEFIESLSPLLSKTTNQTKVYGADVQLSQAWFDIFRTSFGVSGQQNYLNSSASAKHDYNFKAAYIETELTMFDDDLTLKGGLRTDDYSNFGNRTSPSASFAWWLFDKIKTHGLIARAFRAPTFNDLYWPKEDWGVFGGVEGNPNLKPETATSQEIGIGTFVFEKAEADVTYFYNKFKDMIAWTMGSDFWWRPTNVNRAVTKGTEVNLNYQVTDSLKLNLNYTRLSAIDEITNKWLLYRPRHEYKGSINYNLKDRWNFYLTGRYLSKRYTTDDNSRFLENYFVADASISYKVTKHGEINLTVNNILDEDYQEEEDYPMPGTSFLAGVKISF